MTVEQFLRGRGCSHHVLTRLKQTERGILLNEDWAYTNQKLKAGDVLTIRIVEDQSSADLVPMQMPLDIVYEDEDLLVVNKPSDMPIHPSVNNYENTLANGVMYYFAAQGIPFVYRCINRLDRDTSGLLIIAKHYLSSAILSRMSAERQIHREYLAIVEGILPESGKIDAPIARLDGSVLMRCVDYEHGQRAVTHFRRLAVWDYRSRRTALPPVAGQILRAHVETEGCIKASSPSSADHTTSSAQSPSKVTALQSPPDSKNRCLSLAAVTLETGRTHQIRVHMSHIGHPLIGDFLYNPARAQTSISQTGCLNADCTMPANTAQTNSTYAAQLPSEKFVPPIGRQALHSHKLEFPHPITGEPLSFTCEMPEDMRRVVCPGSST